MLNTPQRSTAYYETKDGDIHGPYRVGIASKLQYEKTAKARGWDADEKPFTLNLFFAWHASKQAGAHEQTFDEFTAATFDAWITYEDVPGLGPTQSAPADES
ncbi:hypothetical protein [Arthrobacter sp. RCC_34]|uniref:hypothetical protein n=1 Tax=Arthrobacter sp. RCC_34 TaxID=3239230 RepID=UPI003526ADFA